MVRHAAVLALLIATALPAAAQSPAPQGAGPAAAPTMRQGQGPGPGAGSGPMMGAGPMMGSGRTVSPGPGAMMGGRGPAWAGDDESPDAWRYDSAMMAGLMLFGPADRPLSVEEVRRIVDARLAWLRNDRLALGAVKEKDADTATTEIVARQGGAVVSVLEVDRNTAAMRAAP